eukprot:5664184-Pyramimonas_sp.AAC.1
MEDVSMIHAAGQPAQATRFGEVFSEDQSALGGSENISTRPGAPRQSARGKSENFSGRPRAHARRISEQTDVTA